MSEYHRRKKRHRKKKISRARLRRRRLLVGIFVVIAGITVAIVYGLMHHYVGKFPADKICDNIYIGDVNVSGMTQEEAKQEMQQHLAQSRTKVITLQVEGKSAEATLEELGLGYKGLDKTVHRAVNYGKEGSTWSRFRKLRKLSKEKLVLKEEFILNAEKTGTVLAERAVPLADHAEDALIERSGNGFLITPEKEGKTVDIDGSVSGLEKVLNDEWKHEDTSFEVALEKEEPKITEEDLQTIQDELGTFSTDAGGGDRWQNLKTGVDYLDGTVLMPGEELSVHDRTSPYDAEHGYVEAGAYESGQVVSSYGGGICQVSTTLYNAALYAELEIIERYPHSMLVSYVSPSRDAAIGGDVLDFVFRNSYDTPIYIVGEIDSANQLRFTIYGRETRDPGRKVEFESETLSTEEYGITYKEDPEAELGSMTYAGSPHTGKEAQLWKIVYQDGVEVSRDVINTSSYAKSDQIIKVGTSSKNAQASALVRAAIATQDQTKINEAISQAGRLGQSGGNEATGGTEETGTTGGNGPADETDEASGQEEAADAGEEEQEMQ